MCQKLALRLTICYPGVDCSDIARGLLVKIMLQNHVSVYSVAPIPNTQPYGNAPVLT